MSTLIPGQAEIQRTVTHLIDVFLRSDCEIRPHFFLAGPSGSGRS